MDIEVPVFQEDKYKVNERLGKGEFSTVYKGTRIDGQPVIIKVFNEGYKIEYIEEEIRAIHDLRSPYVNQELDFGQMIVDDKERMVLILEPAENNLSHFANRLELSQIKAIFRQLIDGLQFIHNHNYVHADIKEDNILIRRPENEEPEAFYGDLGMAEKRGKSPEPEFQKKVAKDKVKLLLTLLDLLLYKYTRDALMNAQNIMRELETHRINQDIPSELKALVFFVYDILVKSNQNPSYDNISEALNKF